MASNNSPKGVIGGALGSERRRSSASSGAKFNNLMNQKRNSADMSAAARKASFDEQKPAMGFAGNLWHRVVDLPAPIRELGLENEDDEDEEREDDF